MSSLKLLVLLLVLNIVGLCKAQVILMLLISVNFTFLKNIIFFHIALKSSLNNDKNEQNH